MTLDDKTPEIANARLLAAAPELLRIARALAYHFPLDALGLRDPRHEYLAEILGRAEKIFSQIEGDQS